MIETLSKGKYVARPAISPADMAAMRTLRHRCFGPAAAQEGDVFDARSTHILVEDRADGALVCCYRLMLLDGGSLNQSYAAQFYGLGTLAVFKGRMLELGRFCVAPDRPDPDILRIAWAVMTDFVDREQIHLLFGCASFAGVDTAVHLDAFALLRARHLAPERWSPQVTAPEVFRYAARLRRKPDLRKGWAGMPPLLRTYLMMGGWVSDHAVVDHAMNTLHVFTGLEIAAIPDRRKSLLRALV